MSTRTTKSQLKTWKAFAQGIQQARRLEFLTNFTKASRVIPDDLLPFDYTYKIMRMGTQKNSKNYFLHNNIQQQRMRRQCGRIYSRDLSRSMEKSTNRTIKKDKMDSFQVPKNSFQTSFDSDSLSSQRWKYTECKKNQTKNNEYEKENELINQDSRFMDSLAQYENPTLRNNEIIKKLTCLNNIFKDIKELKEGKMSYQLKCELSDVEDKLLEVERNLLKEAY